MVAAKRGEGARIEAIRFDHNALLGFRDGEDIAFAQMKLFHDLPGKRHLAFARDFYNYCLPEKHKS